MQAATLALSIVLAALFVAWPVAGEDAVPIGAFATPLRVAAAGEPPADVPKVQAAMLSDQVLDVDRYPDITFESTAVAVRSKQVDSSDLDVQGHLTVHGVTRSVSVPVRVELTAGETAGVTCLDQGRSMRFWWGWVRKETHRVNNSWPGEL